MICAHIIDSRGVYLRTERLDAMGPQPSRAVYAAVPSEEPGSTRLWRDARWWQVPDADVPPIIVPDPPVSPVPQSVTPAQGLMALYVLKGITEDDVLAAIGTIEDVTLRYQAQIAYKKATAWDRVSITMQTVAALMALTEHDLDELFTLAATYTNL